MTTRTVLLSTSEGPAGGQIARIVLNRPEAMNALSRALIGELGHVLDELHAKPPRAVIVTGAGEKAFCAGADLKERLTMSHDETRAFVTQLGHSFDRLALLPAPVIAAINGLCFGGGMELALACDFRLVVAGAQLGLPEVRVGILPGAGGTQRLPKLIGAARAKDLILTGRRIDAATACAIGLCTQMAEGPGALEAQVDALLGELAQCAPISVREAKLAIDEGLGVTHELGAAAERAHYEICLNSDDRDEALRAFSEKRAPRFQGR